MNIIPSLNFHNDIKKICDPLIKLNINYFAHAHLKTNKQLALICNHPEFMETYYHNQYYNIDIHTTDIKNYGSYIIWDFIPRDGKTLQMGKDALSLKIHHTFSMVEKKKDGLHFYHFSTHINDERFNQTYLSNLDLLRLFVDYFKKELTEKNLLQVYDHKIELAADCKFITKSTNQPLRIANNLFDIPKNHVSSKNVLSLSKREIQILKLVTQGLTSFQIAENIFISRRTVEHHISNIKFKLMVNTKAELIQIGLLYL